jgi:hypothetical protein
MQPEKDPPTHTAYCQHQDKGRFREWCYRGPAWVETTPEGEVIVRVFEMIPTGPRGYDGYIWCFPKGMKPPPQLPPQEKAQRPGALQSGQPHDTDEDGF